MALLVLQEEQARQEAEAVVREETSMKAVVLLQRRIRAWGARRQLL
jgi:hypothetical protein